MIQVSKGILELEKESRKKCEIFFFINDRRREERARERENPFYQFLLR